MSRTNDSEPRSSELTTDTGVRIIVNHPPAPPPTRARAPEPPRETIVVVPLNQPAQDLEAFARALDAEHGAYILELLRRRGILPESAKDLAQEVLLRVLQAAQSDDPPKDLRAYIFTTVRNEISNHRTIKEREAERIDRMFDEDLLAETAAPSAPTPESEAQWLERWAKMERYLALLPPEEAEVVRVVCKCQMTVEDAAEALGRPRSTVAAQLARAKARLRELAVASERGTVLGGGGSTHK